VTLFMKNPSYTLRFMACIMIIILTGGLLLADETKVSVNVSRQELSLRERFDLSFEFENFSGTPEPDVSSLTDFMVLAGPSKSNQFTWINGQSTKIYTVTYTLAPLKTGRLTIPSFTFKDKRKAYSTEEQTIVVHEPQSVRDGKAPESPPKPFYLELEASNDEPYPGEPFTLSYKVYFRQNIRNYHVDRSARFTGFLTDYLSAPRSPRVRTETIDGVSYQTAILQEVVLTPTQSGTFTIPPQLIRLEVESTSARRRSIFDDPFGMGLQLRNVDVVSPELTVNVRSLPKNPPKTFTGAVGEFTLHAAFDTNVVEENQATTLMIKVNGKGNFKNFTFPKPEFPEQFMVFEPENKENIQLDSEGYTGSKRWEYVLIPNYQGTYYFEPVEFSFFSPKERRYRTLRVSDLILKVTPNTRLSREQKRGLTRQEVELLAQDIRFIQLKEKKIIPHDADKTIRLVDWTGYIISFAIILIGFIFSIIKSFILNNPAYLRKKAAFRTMEKKVRELPEDPDIIVSELPKIFSQYVSDKSVTMRQNLTRSDVLDYCIKRKVSEKELLKIREWWNKIEELNYMPSDINKDIAEQLRDQMTELIKMLEKQ
jgi:hypothetical protein